MVFIILIISAGLALWFVAHHDIKQQEPYITISNIRRQIKQAGSIEELKAIRKQIVWLEEKYPDTAKRCKQLNAEVLSALHNNKMSEEIEEVDNAWDCLYMEKQLHNNVN